MKRSVIILIMMVLYCTSAAAQTFPYPKIPRKYKTTEQRREYLATHFWDNFRFDGNPAASDDAFMEQAVSDFWSTTDKGAAESAVSSMLAHATVNEESFHKIFMFSEKYLYDPDSPMKDEEMFKLFLKKAVTAADESDGYVRGRGEYLLNDMELNAPGTTAASFGYLTKDGKSHRLNTERNTILIFYQPDCTHCRSKINEIRQSPAIKSMVSEKGLDVIAVNLSGDRREWRSESNLLDKSWTDAIVSSDELFEESLYTFRKYPAIYLLGPGNKVILKDETEIADIISAAMRH